MTLKNTIVFGGLLLASLSACAGRFVDYREREISHVYEAKGVTKDSIFQGAKIWIGESFRNSKQGTLVEERDRGILLCKVSIPMPCASGFTCAGVSGDNLIFNMKIEAKDERFRATFSSLSRQYGNGAATIAGQETSQMLISDTSAINAHLLGYGEELRGNLAKQYKSDSW